MSNIKPNITRIYHTFKMKRIADGSKILIFNVQYFENERNSKHNLRKSCVEF